MGRSGWNGWARSKGQGRISGLLRLDEQSGCGIARIDLLVARLGLTRSGHRMENRKNKALRVELKVRNKICLAEIGDVGSSWKLPKGRRIRQAERRERIGFAYWNQA